MLLCQGLVLAKYTIAGPFHEVTLANPQALSSPDPNRRLVVAAGVAGVCHEICQGEQVY